MTVQIPQDNAGIYGMLHRQIVPMNMWLIKPSGRIRGGFFSFLGNFIIFEVPFAKRTPIILRLWQLGKHVCLAMLETQRKNILDTLWVPVTSARQILSSCVLLEWENEGQKDRRMKIFSIRLMENSVMHVKSTWDVIFVIILYVLVLQCPMHVLW